MNLKLDEKFEKRRFFDSLMIPFIISVLMILSLVLEKGMDWDFHKAGVHPRDIKHIWGILTMAFVHADWNHLFNNVTSFFVLATALYYFYREIANKILIYSYLICGLLLWIIGRESWHIGASGLIYALVFFLFVSGVLRKYVPLIAISLIVVLQYGSVIWHVMPWQLDDPVSWEGHLSGAVVGIALSFVFRKEGPQNPKKKWEEEDDEDEEKEEDFNENDFQHTIT